MNMPPLLLSAVLLFWGLQTDRLIIALLLCFVLEGSSLIHRRYDFSQDDFVKISDLTSLLFLGAVALILLNYEPRGFLRITTGWLPLILAPLMAAQLYSEGDTVTIGTRFGSKKKAYVHKPLDFRFYYIAACLFGAACGNSSSLWFFPFLAVIMALLLFANRGRAFAPFVVVICLGFSLALGYLGSMAMEKAHGYVMQNSFRFLYRYYREQHANPFKVHVNFGDTGRQKSSGEIIMRVASNTPPPSLFKEAVYTTFQRGDWFGNIGSYEFLVPEDPETWHLVEPPHRRGKMLTLELSLPKEQGLLPHPTGSYLLSSSTIFELEQHENGSLKIVDGATVVTSAIAVHPEMRLKNDIPSGKHLAIPEDERYVLEEVHKLLEVDALSSEKKIAALRDFFSRDFTYSLNLLGRGEYSTPLGNFLLQSKNGFCEYYATATALLLRTLGIPSRYAVGYVVAERSNLEDKYLVRQRHAHAWAEAYVDGEWVVVDTTPSQWFEIDAERASPFEKISDIFNLIHHKYKIFQIGSGRDYTMFYSIVVVLLTAFLVIRIYRRMKLERAASAAGGDTFRTFTRMITPFTPVIDSLARSQQPRLAHESFAGWACRCRSWKNFDTEEFARLYALHLQIRFDPRGVSAEMLEILDQGARKYLRELKEMEEAVQEEVAQPRL
jgi:protein-glutamine gamma-glutamyltransferase